MDADFSQPSPNSRGTYRHHSSSQDLQHSAEHCPLCKMIEHEILQSYAFRSLKGAQVQILGEDVVHNRGALTLGRNIEYTGSKVGILSPVYLRTVAKGPHDTNSHIQILLSDWIDVDAIDRARDKASYTDWREEWKRTSGRGEIPKLDVFTYISWAPSAARENVF